MRTVVSLSRPCTLGEMGDDNLQSSSQNRRMRNFLFLFLIVVGAGFAYPQTPTASTVHSSVPIAAQPTNSYALYLPSAYSPAKRWPLLLIFDPFARGEVSAKLFHDAAEKYGFIL